jgi:hypothetical protein
MYGLCFLYHKHSFNFTPFIKSKIKQGTISTQGALYVKKTEYLF